MADESTTYHRYPSKFKSTQPNITDNFLISVKLYSLDIIASAFSFILSYSDR